MTLSHVASKLIYELIINNDSKYAALYFVARIRFLIIP